MLSTIGLVLSIWTGAATAAAIILGAALEVLSSPPALPCAPLRRFRPSMASRRELGCRTAGVAGR